MKLINHVLDIRRLIQQAFDNRFSRMGLRADAPVDASALQEEQKEKRVKLDDIMHDHLKETGGNYAPSTNVSSRSSTALPPSR